MSGWYSPRTVYKSLGLISRLPVFAVQWSSGYKRARNEFRRQLIASGIPREEARELADLYPFKMADIIEAARNAR
ncbi:hypothetical protein JXL21_08220 [Candidatus Bathyarchaeota archaeon]|nr:hypothetical protein [Candidatus Bathyarchaeota archaeon]